MSRRRWQSHLWFRSLTALFGVWFVLATTEVTSLHACPMHDGPPAGMSGTGHESGAATAGTAMAGTAMAGMDMSSHAGHSMPGDGTGTPDDHHSCTCISTCCAATVTPLAATAESLRIAAQYTSAPAISTTAPESPRVVWIDFVLPFANAPPMLANA